MRKGLYKNIAMKVLGIVLLSELFGISAYAKTFQVQIVTQPAKPNSSFTGKIIAADFNDPTPNACYGIRNCYYAGFVNSKSWGDWGRSGYTTTDNVLYLSRSDVAYKAKTMGELARELSKNNLLSITLKDYLPASLGSDPTFCVYVSSNGFQVGGSLASNCADAPVAPTACGLTPESIEFDWGTIPNTLAGKKEIFKLVNVSCTRPTKLGLFISGEYISLNGNKDTRAEFNLGQGWTGKTVVDVKDQVNVQIKSRLVGLEQQSGKFTGSSVLMMELL